MSGKIGITRRNSFYSILDQDLEYLDVFISKAKEYLPTQFPIFLCVSLLHSKWRAAVIAEESRTFFFTSNENAWHDSWHFVIKLCSIYYSSKNYCIYVATNSTRVSSHYANASLV